jgi:ABC-2 type transport system permease protein
MAVTSIPGGTPATVASSRVDAHETARPPQHVVFVRTARQALRSGATWGTVFGIYTALQAIAYTSTYKTLAQRRALAKSMSLSGGLNALAGPARDLQTVGGYTVWKSLGFLSVIGAIWALLLGTKLLRGEEESGRAEVLLGGPLTRRNATIQYLLGLAAGVVALFACTSFFVVLVGREHAVHWAASASLFFALSATCSAALFMAVGAFTSQLVTSRRRAAGYAGGALGVAFAIRMVSDATTGATWMHWLTPLGWIEKLGAFTAPSPLALLPLAGATATLAAASVWLSGVRDLDAGLLRERTSARAHTALLGGPMGLATRLSGPIIAAWLAGVAAYALLLGAVADTAAKALEDSPSVRAALDRLGGHAGLVKAYLGVSCLLLTLLVMLLAASQLTAARREEASGRAEHLFVRPVSRTRWMLSRLAIASAAMVLAGLLGGVFMWIGTTSQHANVSFSTLLDAGLNSVPAGLCLLGIGALAWSFLPRLATSCVYAVLVWSFLVEIIASVGHTNRWLLDTSILHHVTLAPAVAPDWTSGVVLVGIGALASTLGLLRFAHRDLAGS